MAQPCEDSLKQIAIGLRYGERRRSLLISVCPISFVNRYIESVNSLYLFWSLYRMKFRIPTLPKQGLTSQECLTKEQLNNRLNESSRNIAEFLSDAIITLRLIPRQYGADLTVHIEATYQQPCGRCNQPQPLALTVDNKAVLKARSNPDDIEDDLSLVYYDDDSVELTEYLEELTILSLDPFWTPTLKEDGRCSSCDGKNQIDVTETEPVNGGLRLGDLLQKAIKK